MPCSTPGRSPTRRPPATLTVRHGRSQPAGLDARRQHHRPVHPGRGGGARLTTRRTSSTSCTTTIGYNSYTGSLRGARGTLWSSAGNALDVASLGVALLRASGIPAQYVAGTLSHAPGPATHPFDVPGQLSDGGLHPGRNDHLRPGRRFPVADRNGEPLLVPVRHGQRLGQRRPADGRGRRSARRSRPPRARSPKCRKACGRRPRSSSPRRSTARPLPPSSLAATGCRKMSSSIRRSTTSTWWAGRSRLGISSRAQARSRLLHRRHQYLLALHLLGRRSLPIRRQRRTHFRLRVPRSTDELSLWATRS